MTGKRGMQTKEKVSSKELLIYKNLHCLSNADLAVALKLHESTISTYITNGEMPKYVYHRLVDIMKPKSIPIK